MSIQRQSNFQRAREELRKLTLENDKLEREVLGMRKPLRQLLYISNYGPLATILVAVFGIGAAYYHELPKIAKERADVEVRKKDSALKVALIAEANAKRQTTIANKAIADATLQREISDSIIARYTMLQKLIVQTRNQTLTEAKRKGIIQKINEPLSPIQINVTPAPINAPTALPVDAFTNASPSEVQLHIPKKLVIDTFDVFGTLVDKNNRPIQGVEVAPRLKLMNFDANGVIVEPQKIVTDASGNFKVRLRQPSSRTFYELRFITENPSSSAVVRTPVSIRNKTYVISIVQD